MYYLWLVSFIWYQYPPKIYIVFWWKGALQTLGVKSEPVTFSDLLQHCTHRNTVHIVTSNIY